MQFTEKLRTATFLKRYKRFFADVELDGQTVVAHVPNTGSLKTCLQVGAPCVVTESSNPERKLKVTLQFIKTQSGWAGVNTSLPNALVYEAWEQGQIPAWQKYKFAKREVKLSKETRLDLVLAPSEEDFLKGHGLHYIEVKNVTLAEGHTALFPDAETERGRKHLRELIQLVKEGKSAEMVFVIQREGCTEFAPADQIDPEYGQLLRDAKAKGVQVSAYACEIWPASGIQIRPKALPILF